MRCGAACQAPTQAALNWLPDSLALPPDLLDGLAACSVEQAVLVEDHQVDEVAHSGIVAAAEVAVHRVELLRCVTLHVDDLDCRDVDARERSEFGPQGVLQASCHP